MGLHGHRGGGFTATQMLQEVKEVAGFTRLVVERLALGSRSLLSLVPWSPHTGILRDLNNHGASLCREKECCPGGEAGAGRGHGDTCASALQGHPAESSLCPEWDGVASKPPPLHPYLVPLPFCPADHSTPAHAHHGHSAVQTSPSPRPTAPWPGPEAGRPRRSRLGRPSAPA